MNNLPQVDTSHQLARDLRMTMLAVLALLSVLTLAGLVAGAVGLDGFRPNEATTGLTGLGVAIVTLTWLALPLGIRLGRVRLLAFLAFSGLSFATLLATLLLGGITSISPYLYTLIILATALLLGRLPALLMASLSLGLHGAATVYEYLTVLQPSTLWPVPPEQLTAVSNLLASVVVLAIVFYAIALMAGQLHHLLTEQNHFLSNTAELMQQEQLKTRFLTAVAHELHLSLTSTRGFLQEAAAGTVQPEALPALLAQLQDNVTTITHQVNEIISLQTSELVLDKTEPVDLAELVQQVVLKNRLRAAVAGVTLSLTADALSPWIEGDSAALQRVVGALVDNAIKFSPGGGRVRLKLRQRDGWVKVIVSDQGVGIPAADLPHIFERFYRGQGAIPDHFGGLGLGLTIAQQVVEAHGGQIDVSSEPGRGSTFTISLPVDPAATIEPIVWRQPLVVPPFVPNTRAPRFKH